jgi:hypothetical protein
MAFDFTTTTQRKADGMNENVRVIARHDDDTETDVTEGVQVLYDHCVASMDWGSGFLSIEDARGIILIAQKCGFLVPETAAKEFEEYAKNMGRAWPSYGNAALSIPRSSGLTCILCLEPVFYFADGYLPEVYAKHGRHKGWNHENASLDSDHPVKLWPVA